MWWYDEYRGQTNGRILHAIEVYCGFDAAEYAQIGGGNVILRGELIANCQWEGDSDTPVMEWFGENAEEYKRNEFLLRPFLDDKEIALRQNPRCVVQLIQQVVTLWEALAIQGWMQHEDGESYVYPSLKEKIRNIVSDYYPNRPETWWHFAKAAAYDMKSYNV